jgi:hypothetical protein
MRPLNWACFPNLHSFVSTSRLPALLVEGFAMPEHPAAGENWYLTDPRTCLICREAGGEGNSTLLTGLLPVWTHYECTRRVGPGWLDRPEGWTRKVNMDFKNVSWPLRDPNDCCVCQLPGGELRSTLLSGLLELRVHPDCRRELPPWWPNRPETWMEEANASAESDARSMANGGVRKERKVRGKVPLNESQRRRAITARDLKAERKSWVVIEDACRDKDGKLTPRTTLLDWINKLEREK